MTKRKLIKVVSAILLTPIALIMVVGLLLYVPSVQQWALRQVTSYAKETTGLDISTGKVRIAFPFDLKLNQLLITQGTDSLLTIEEAIVDLDFSHLPKLQIGVDAIQLTKGKVNTRDLIASSRIAGTLERLHLNAESIDISQGNVQLGNIILDGCHLDITLCDTTLTEDTIPSTPIKWELRIPNICIQESHIGILMESDSTSIMADIREATLDSAIVNLEKGIYQGASFVLCTDSIRYNRLNTPHTPQGFDPNHIHIDNSNIEVDNIHFLQNPLNLTCVLNQGSAQMVNGIRLDSISSQVYLNEENLTLHNLKLKTEESKITCDTNVDFKALNSSEGELYANLHGQIGRNDVLWLGGNAIPNDIRNVYPHQPLNIWLNGKGNASDFELSNLRANFPSILDIQTSGNISNFQDSAHLNAALKWDISTGNLQCVSDYLRLDSITLPPMGIHAKTCLTNGRRVSADAFMHEKKGSVHLLGNIDLKSMAYELRGRVKNLTLNDFLPMDSLCILSVDTKISGWGTDMLATHTRLDAQIHANQWLYGSNDLSNIKLRARLEKEKGLIEFNSNNNVLKMDACAEALVKERKLNEASFCLNLNRMDLYALQITQKPLSIGAVLQIKGKSDFKQTHSLHGKAEAMEMALADTTYHPLDINIDADLTPESIELSAQAGDLNIKMSSDEGQDSLLYKSRNFLTEIKRQTDSLRIDQDTLRTLLPHVNMQMTCGKNNPLHNVLRSLYGYTFSGIDLNVQASPDKGLHGKSYMTSLHTGGILLDSIQCHIAQDKDVTNITANVKNTPKNKVAVFETTLHARLKATGVELQSKFIDAKGKEGVNMGLKADVLKDGIRVHFTPLNPVIAYRNFTFNEDNFIQLTRQGRLNAHVDLLADDQTGLKLESSSSEEVLQDISLSINHLNLNELIHVMPFAPNVEGFLHSDIHYLKVDSTNITLSTDTRVDSLVYEGTAMGDIGVNVIYFPNTDGSHHVNAITSQNDREIVSLSGLYQTVNEEGMIEGEATLNKLPMNLANAFLPKGLLRIEGYADGTLAVNGKFTEPVFNGALQTDSMYIASDDYSVNLRIPNDTLRVENSFLDFDKIEAYAVGKTPLTLDGNVDFRDFNNVNLSINVAARNYQLMNAPRTKQATAYGKVFVNLNSRIWGTTDNLKMRGLLSVLGNTEVTYILKDSPITVQDQLADLVTFCDFSDTTKAEPITMKRQNIDVQMNINIEQAAQVHCLLSENGSDYVNLQGGGTFNMTYDLQNDLQLWGKYTIQQGKMRYSIMAIPLKDFNISSGSYVEFQGDLMNPRLSIKASERLKASVTENNTPRNVAFDVGLSLSQTLENMGLEFTLESPEDATMQNQLASMTAEERGRIAVTMLVTGMYMSDDFNLKSGFSYSNTLNTYLQSAINQIAGQAFRTVDLNFGIENSTTSTGSTTTDYSFSFAKRFWGNRISFIIGGKVSTGEDAVNNGQTIIDNVSLEYRLDKSATRYVRLYYDREYESLLEGELTEMGAGIVLRKRSDKLSELFRFRQGKDGQAQMIGTRRKEEEK